MASDSDGSNSSVVILRCIHEKLVEYNTFLLRQLVDEQKVALAASEELAPEDLKEDRDNSVAEQEVALSEGNRIRQEEEANAAVVETLADAVSEVDTDELVDSRFRCSDSSVVGPALADEPEKLINETISVDIGLKKRRLGRSGRKDYTGEKEENRKIVLETAAGQESLSQGTPYRVSLKTSVPPNKYLLQKRREEEASDREAAHQQQQPLLLASSATVKRITCSKRSVLTPRSSSASVDLAKAEFDRRLREHVRLHREVNRRSHIVTRKRQLPRLPTPACGKTHWDFLLEEMKWMATDFAQERNWKWVLQRRLAADVIVAQNSGSVRQELENRQIARGVALQISAFLADDGTDCSEVTSAI
ncbi:unnamed protein product [Peronospora destructor]|uniref:HSA domain-containing protein n=1 Tax=Peronospora destructor TaxID=86335 RepID=A0AAV0T3T9_9STRA|nr:unnamed protein product [Peronospora destructor]